MRALVILAVLCCACGSKEAAPLAELVKVEGGLADKQTGGGAWADAKVGTTFVMNDAARTANGTAGLTIVGAAIAMQPHTILRFGPAPGAKEGSRISVELGAIDLTGTGSYALDIGDVKLSAGASVRITAKGHGESVVELTAGQGQVTTNGQTLDLAIGKTIELSLEGSGAVVDAAPPPVDAAPVIDAAPPPDAPPIATGSTIEGLTGKKVEILPAGEKTWKAAEAGMALAVGTKVRVGAGSTAKVTSGGGSLDMGNGARAEIESDLAIGLEAGSAKASTPPGGAAKFIVPGGGASVRGTADSAGETRLDIGGRDTKVTVLRAGSKLTGASGAELDMNRGESATITRTGVIHPLEAIPTYVDFKLAVGETATLHDPRGATAVQFAFGGKCPNGGVVELDRDGRFRSAKQSAGKDAANLMVTGGGWAYRLRCSTAGGDEGTAVASGRLGVVADSGSRALPKKQPDNDIDADGRTWRISYQSVIPNLHVLYKGPPGSAWKLHLASAGKDETYDAATTKITVPGAKLHEGTYTYWFDRDGTRDPKTSTLKIDFDQTAPQVYIESPIDRQPWTGDIDVRGAVLPGWTAAVGDVTIPIDAQKRFAAKVAPPSGQNALGIKLSHPQRGVHYYLRRPK